MKHLAFYGASDDLIEIEGDFREEVNQEEARFEIAGLQIDVIYEGVWGIYVRQIDEDIAMTADNLKLTIQLRMDGEPGYSMRLDLDVPDDEIGSLTKRVAALNSQD
jgi:hypothetical protein